MFFCWTVSEHSLWYDGTRHVRPIRNFRIGTSLSNRISNREVLFEFESNLEQHWCSEPAPPQASALPCTIQCFIVDVNKSWNQVAFSMLQSQRSSNGRRADELLSNGSRTAIESKSNRSLILKMMMTALVTVVCSYNRHTSQNSHPRPPVGKSWIRHCLSARSAAVCARTRIHTVRKLRLTTTSGVPSCPQCYTNAPVTTTAVRLLIIRHKITVTKATHQWPLIR